MIKISIPSNVKKEIEKIYIDDARNAKTGIIRILSDNHNAEWLRKNYASIYAELFPEEVLDIAKVEELLLADRNRMKEYITKLGAFGKASSDELQKKIFKYDTFSNRDASNIILQKLDIRVCPYCNRQYIITLKNRKARPQWDHYYPKSEYPYLALSIYNMIPSCGVCNMAKSNLDTFKTPILYPYEEEFGNDIQFALKIKPNTSISRFVHGQSKSFNIELSNPSNKYIKEIKQQIDKLHILDLYEEHKDYICDILKNNYINSDKRIEELCRLFPKIFKNKDEVKDVLFFSSLNKDKWGNRPFAKLTTDVLNITKLKKNG